MIALTDFGVFFFCAAAVVIAVIIANAFKVMKKR